MEPTITKLIRNNFSGRKPIAFAAYRRVYLQGLVTILSLCALCAQECDATVDAQINLSRVYKISLYLLQGILINKVSA